MVEGLFKAVRDRLGNDIHLLLDVHNRLTPIESARLGKLVSLVNCTLVYCVALFFTSLKKFSLRLLHDSGWKNSPGARPVN